MSAFQDPDVSIYERHGFVVFLVLVVHFLVQEVYFILGPVLSDFSQNIVQSCMYLGNIVTHILLLVQCFQVLEYMSLEALVGQISKMSR